MVWYILFLNLFNFELLNIWFTTISIGFGYKKQKPGGVETEHQYFYFTEEFWINIAFIFGRNILYASTFL